MTLRPPRADILEAAIKTFYEEDFPSLERIDAGAEAVTYQGQSAIYGDVCVKCFHSKAIIQGSKREVKSLLKHSFHPNIVRVLGFYEEKVNSQQQAGYVMEFMAGGSLHSAIYSGEHYFDADAYNWIIQAARGLQYLHEANIIHRDIKPKNMLLDKRRETLKLSDFGLAKDLDSHTVTHNGGTIPYMAPELISQGGRAFGSASDVYALGISMLEIFQRQPPYGRQAELALLSKVVAGERPAIASNLDSAVAQLLRRTWATDPLNRCTIMDIVKFANSKLGGTAESFLQTNRSTPTAPKAHSAVVEQYPSTINATPRSISYPVIRKETPLRNLPKPRETFVEQQPDRLVNRKEESFFSAAIKPKTAGIFGFPVNIASANTLTPSPPVGAQHPLPILCTVKKIRVYDEYGFRLRCETGGIVIDQVEYGGFGYYAGLRSGQWLVGVNETIINKTTTYKDVVVQINKFPRRVALLVAPEDVKKWYAAYGRQFSFDKVRMVQ